MLKKILFKIKLNFSACKENNYRPKFLDSDFLLFLIIFLLVFKFFSFLFLVYFQQSSLFADIAKSALINLVNSERLSLGIEPLAENRQLNRAAYLRAKHMMENDYFAHQSPDGTSYLKWIEDVGYNYKYAGENLAIGFLDSDEAHNAWLESYSHRENILNSKYKEIGIAVVKGEFQGNETLIAVQVFGAPSIAPNFLSGSDNISQSEPAVPAIEKKQDLNDNQRISAQKQVFPSFNIGQEEKRSSPNIFFSNILKFVYFNLDDLAQIFAVMLLILISILLALTIPAQINFQNNNLIFKTIIFIIILSLSIFIDKALIIQIIPHNFSI